MFMHGKETLYESHMTYKGDYATFEYNDIKLTPSY